MSSTWSGCTTATISICGGGLSRNRETEVSVKPVIGPGVPLKNYAPRYASIDAPLVEYPVMRNLPEGPELRPPNHLPQA